MESGISYIEAKDAALQAVNDLITESEDVPDVEPAIVDGETIERTWGWVFFWNTRLYAETGDLEHALVGTAPVCVNRTDGSACSVTAAWPIEREIKRYERLIGARPWWKFW